MMTRRQGLLRLEGMNCNIKHIKRLMYGRANFDLLLQDGPAQLTGITERDQSRKVRQSPLINRRCRPAVRGSPAKMKPSAIQECPRPHWDMPTARTLGRRCGSASTCARRQPEFGRLLG
jgi:hypothetical protein